MPDEFLQIVTATATPDDARRIARALVEQRLAACVQIVGPVESAYRWQGKIETNTEWQCWIKTQAVRYLEVEEMIRRLHPYEVPEIVATPIVAGSKAYLKWLGDETAKERL